MDEQALVRHAYAKQQVPHGSWDLHLVHCKESACVLYRTHKSGGQTKVEYCTLCNIALLLPKYA